MRRIFSGIVGTAFLMALAAPAFADTQTVKGELIDVTCYTKKASNVGEAHKDCGTSCAKKGAPLGVLTTDGTVYTITGDLAADNNAKLVPHVSHTVEVTGEVSEKDGKKMIAGTTIAMAK